MKKQKITVTLDLRKVIICEVARWNKKMNSFSFHTHCRLNNRAGNFWGVIAAYWGLKSLKNGHFGDDSKKHTMCTNPHAKTKTHFKGFDFIIAPDVDHVLATWAFKVFLSLGMGFLHTSCAYLLFGWISYLLSFIHFPVKYTFWTNHFDSILYQNVFKALGKSLKNKLDHLKDRNFYTW